VKINKKGRFVLVKRLVSLVIGCLVAILITNPVSANDERYLSSGNTYSSTLTSSDDEHWYKFTATKDNSDIDIYLSNESAPVRFSIYDSDKDLIDYRETDFFTSKKAGTYYIKVYPYSWGSKYSSGTYDVTVTYANGEVQHNSNTLEPNNTRESAYYLNSGNKISSSLSSSKDDDYYKITTTEDNGDIDIYLSNTSVPVRFSVYDSNKKLIDYRETDYFTTKKAGTYYIEVYPYGWGDKYSSGTYDLIATYSTANVNHNSSTYEPNNTRENAYSVKSGVPIKSTLSSSLDDDYYSITLNRQGNINLQLTETSAPVRFSVYDSKKNNISYRNTSYSRELKAGTYYIEVYPYSWDDEYSSGTYKLKASYPSADSVSNNILLTLNSKTAKVNGKAHRLSEAPYLKNATTLVPLRFISEKLGASVQWNSSDRSIKVLLDGTTIDLKVDSRTVKVNGSYKTIQVGPSIKNGRTFVPIRFVSQQLGRSVNWHPTNKTISIK
jgi:hypothetical protein